MWPWASPPASHTWNEDGMGHAGWAWCLEKACAWVGWSDGQWWDTHADWVSGVSCQSWTNHKALIGFESGSYPRLPELGSPATSPWGWGDQSRFGDSAYLAWPQSSRCGQCPSSRNNKSLYLLPLFIVWCSVFLAILLKSFSKFRHDKWKQRLDSLRKSVRF